MGSRLRAPPEVFSFARFGVSSPTKSADSPTTSRTTVRFTRAPSSPVGRLTSENGVAFPELGLVVAGIGELGRVDSARLPEKCDGIRPHDRFDVRFGDACLLHLGRR